MLKQADLVIVGGGLTGLSAAYIAAKNGNKVIVLEADKQVGGLLNTFEIGGNKLEYYYHHFFTHDKELNWLIDELGLRQKVIFKKTKMGVFSKNKIFPFDSIFDLLKFTPICFFDKILFVFSTLFMGKFAKWERFENISALKWLEKWAGKSTTQALWLPLMNIKFGIYASKVPLSWFVGRMRQRMNSRKNGDERLGYLDGSMQVLTDALFEKLKEMNVEIYTNEAVQKINFSVNSTIEFVETQKQKYFGKKYLFTLPGTILNKLLIQNQPVLAAELNKIEYFGAVCVVLELTSKLSDVYWLNISEKDFPFGGIIEHTNFINPSNYNGSHIAYLSRYFALNEDIADKSNEEIEEYMLNFLPKIYPNFDKKTVKNIFVFKTKTAATVCDFNFSKKIPMCQTTVQNMYIANMSHVYPDERSVNNSIKVASEACKTMQIINDFIENSNSLSAKIGFKK